MKKFKQFLFNTPEKYWLTIRNRHIHKSFWGVTLTGSSAVSWWTTKAFLVSMGLLTAGLGIIALSVAGHIYTNNKPYFKLWDKYLPKSKKG